MANSTSVSAGDHTISTGQLSLSSSREAIYGPVKAQGLITSGAASYVTSDVTGIMLDIPSHGCVVENINFICVSTSTAIDGINAEKSTNTDDLDLSVENCGFGDLTRSINAVGRGFKAKGNFFSSNDICIERSWPTSGTSGTDLQALPHGFRKDEITGNAFHSVGNCITITGSDRTHYRGLIADNMCDIGNDFFIGAGANILFADNYVLHTNSTPFYFDAACGKISITGGQYRGEAGNAVRSPQNIIRFIEDVEDFIMSGVDLGDSDGNTLVFGGDVGGGSITGCLFDNPNQDNTGNQAHIYFSPGTTVRGLTISGNAFKSDTGNNYPVWADGVTFIDCAFEGNAWNNGNGSFVQGAWVDGGGNQFQGLGPTVPNLSNGWANGANVKAAGYRKGADGVVWLEGTIKNGTGIAFTLPVGYRPSAPIRFSLNGTGHSHAYVIVRDTGTITPSVSGSGAFVDLNGISFFAD